MSFPSPSNGFSEQSPTNPIITNTQPNKALNGMDNQVTTPPNCWKAPAMAKGIKKMKMPMKIKFMLAY